MKEGLIALQYWGGDRDKALRLARFIADLEPAKRADVDFMFICRSDCTHDPATVEYVSRKFDVHTTKPKTIAAGHPWACWVTFFSLLEWVYHMKVAKKIPAYKWVLAFEPDCVPVTKNWIDQLREEWNRLNAFVVGSETWHWQQHINGNAMYSADMRFLEWFVRGIGMHGVPPREPYDIFLAPQFIRWGVASSRRIINRCGQKTMPFDEAAHIRSLGWSFIHGVKDDSLFTHAEKLVR